MRWKLVLCALAILTLTGAARAASVLCVDAPGVVALTDARGVELIPNGTVEAIFTVREGALYAAGSRGAYRLYDAAGKPLGDVEFSMIEDAGDALVYRQGGLYGAMSDAGEVLLPPGYTQLTSDGAGGWLALDGDPFDEQADELIHVDAGGAARRIGVQVVGGLKPVSGGRMPFMNGDGRFGAVNARGEVVIDAVWRFIGPFEAGYARAAGPEGLGLIDVGGRTVIAPVYQYLERSAAMTAAFDGEGVDVYPPQGGARRYRLTGPVEELLLVGDGLAVSDGEEVRLYDARGKLLARDEAGTVYAPGNQGQFIVSDGQWGESCQRLINPNGSAASGGFQQLLPLCPGRYAWLKLNGSEYYSAELGGLQMSWDYENALYGLLDGNGRVLLPASFKEIRALSADRLLLIGQDEVRLANRNGVTLKSWRTSEAEAPSVEAGE